MKLTYLGTAAAEGFPSILCKCEKCEKARMLGGRNIRKRSQALINDDLLIDFPCDSYSNLTLNGINLYDIPNVLITHIHADHFYVEEWSMIKKGYDVVHDDWKGLHIYGSKDIVPSLDRFSENTYSKFQYSAVEPFQPFKVGRYTITALKANHSTENPFVYLISDGDKTILYAHDTCAFLEESNDYLYKNVKHIDLVSFDCTLGQFKNIETTNKHKRHMDTYLVGKMREQLKNHGLIDDATICVLNHFSHNAYLGCYDDMILFGKENGYLISYDGLEVEI